MCRPRTAPAAAAQHSTAHRPQHSTLHAQHSTHSAAVPLLRRPQSTARVLTRRPSRSRPPRARTAALTAACPPRRRAPTALPAAECRRRARPRSRLRAADAATPVLPTVAPRSQLPRPATRPLARLPAGRRAGRYGTTCRAARAPDRRAALRPRSRLRAADAATPALPAVAPRSRLPRPAARPLARRAGHCATTCRAARAPGRHARPLTRRAPAAATRTRGHATAVRM
ncbi:uncharacterized protein LOC133896890 [Phragmites australis]|uniref:uncharacterized protein LOC133896890 n=1 Tax=Phragmites australis TaxID=29695 RepID=UPI002D775BF7|nr:uncharacterized protein LOC133896890 [Phragmites australis]